MVRRFIIIKGIVQGVGFRPFIYKIALENNLYGSVYNTSKGVYIDIEGEKENIDIFIKDIRKKAPVLSKIENVHVEDREFIGYKKFKIVASKDEEGITLISPDIGICDDCINDIKNNIENRRYNYPFTNCTNCGPRFSIIKKLPYDRKFTTMNEFNMCDDCKDEYENPLDRRFHAEPTCCKKCGPKISLLDKKGEVVKCGDPIEEVRKYILKGKIIAIKGIGGYNIVCDADNKESILKLRERKVRKSKPLAVMFKDENIVNKYCYLNDVELKVLKSNKKPIVLLKKQNEELPYNISFDSPSIGAVLPYSPLHYLLFDNKIESIVFTSGNISGSPMIYMDNEALIKLNSIVDYYLVHNREINMPVDDSVVKVINSKERIIRNGRGYSPLSINKESKDEILALGGELKNTFSISSKGYIFLSPYLGDMNNIQGRYNINKNIEHMIGMYNINPNVICYDMHPNYWSREYIKELPLKKIGVYHHHAHIASCMGENNIKDKVIGIAYDGAGFGDDGTIWGGEFIVCNYKKFKRVGHVSNFKLPGGDKATENPWRIGVSLIYEALGYDDESLDRMVDVISKDRREIKFILDILDKKINTPVCSSIGRLFDGISSMLGFTMKRSYEGEAAIYLENLAYKFLENNNLYKEHYSYEIRKDNEMLQIDFKRMIIEILKDIDNKKSKEEIALKFHNTVVEFTINLAIKLREVYRLNNIALSGGVFQNEILLSGISRGLEEKEFNVITHKLIPCNDSGISYGQLLIGNNQI
ncbi:carbamoyltransferase HypF [Clostridium sardiniense]|uniref:carbamoyltransferase HypF n=1 Tax=Clostridium sardiniense TaxID=29369 RepID=UPI001957AED5|nr:carbamoyltransferase HypF [Clostridium sardiniense]MBM7833497.1 hydrogenase maturation protein HypF [Clostridium sardiniense]